MRKSQLLFLCETFGNPDLPDNEKWKCIKYIFIENPIVDVQRLLKRREIIYIDNKDIGPGFYILGHTNAELNVTKNEKVVTFIPLKMIDKISIITTLGNNGDDDPDAPSDIIVTKNGDTLIINSSNFDITTFEDIIIINNAIADTDGDSLIIDTKK